MNLAKFYDDYKSSVVIHVLNGRVFVSTDSGKTMQETTDEKLHEVIYEFTSRTALACAADQA